MDTHKCLPAPGARLPAEPHLFAWADPSGDGKNTLGTMGWALIGTSVLAGFLTVFWARSQGRRALGRAQETERVADLRRAIRHASTLITLFGTGACSLGAVLAFDAATHARLQALGIAILIYPLAFIVLLSLATLSSFRRVRGMDWDWAAYAELLLSATWTRFVPGGTTVALAGSVLWLYDRLHSGSDPTYAAFAVAGTAAGWILQWPILSAISLPGRAVEFPMRDLEAAAKNLAAKMGQRLRALLLLRSRRIAGAFSVDVGRVAITDYFLSALSYEEFLAVMAHEFRHFDHRREAYRILPVGLCICLALSFLGAWGGSWAGIPPYFGLLAAGPAWIAFFRFQTARKRLNEDDADDAAVEFVGAWPLMMGIAKSYALNKRIGDCSKRGDIHRSLRDRLQRIATRGGLPDSKAAEAIQIATACTSQGAGVSLTSTPLEVPSHG